MYNESISFFTSHAQMTLSYINLVYRIKPIICIKRKQQISLKTLSNSIYYVPRTQRR